MGVMEPRQPFLGVLLLTLVVAAAAEVKILVVAIAPAALEAAGTAGEMHQVMPVLQELLTPAAVVVEQRVEVGQAGGQRLEALAAPASSS